MAITYNEDVHQLILKLNLSQTMKRLTFNSFLVLFLIMLVIAHVSVRLYYLPVLIFKFPLQQLLTLTPRNSSYEKIVTDYISI